MSLPLLVRQRFSVQDTLGAADTSKTLKDVGAGETIHVLSVTVTSLVASAQTLYVGDTSGTVKAISLGISLVVNSQAVVQLMEGLALTEGEDLIIKPAAAGPSVHVVAEGYVIKRGAALV